MLLLLLLLILLHCGSQFRDTRATATGAAASTATAHLAGLATELTAVNWHFDFAAMIGSQEEMRMLVLSPLSL